MCRFITCSVITFATVIAITKDLPDVEGDRKYGIETFSTRLGTRAVAFLGELPALLFERNISMPSACRRRLCVRTCLSGSCNRATQRLGRERRAPLCLTLELARSMSCSHLNCDALQAQVCLQPTMCQL